MSYLRLIQDTLQNMAITLASALNVDVVIADKHLIRIAGTGKFDSKLDKSCAEDSLFANVIKTGQPQINLRKENSPICRNCSNLANCYEYANMTYPIKTGNNIVGVISFTSFNEEQRNIISYKRNEYLDMLKHMADTIDKEIVGIKVKNKLKKNIAEVNEIINCLNKGIIILNSNMEIIHINIKALKILDADLSHTKIINSPIDSIIGKIKLQDTNSEDIMGYWNINGEDVRVIYNINKLYLEDDKLSYMISFDRVIEIVNIAKTYESKEEIVFSNIIGKSEPLLKAINKSKVVAKTDSTVLLQGASGTGKELFARSIHNESPRKEGPFVVINCASLPENIIESELFGYEQGAFTGANPRGKRGKIELANNGTLFLDEIGDFPLHLQTRLLRVLQEKQIDRVGGEDPIDINIRVISATHRDLESLVKEGRFRLDLFYRLNTVPIHLPTLKERDHDIFLCSQYIIEKLCSKMNRDIKYLSKEVKYAFLEYDWPGNIRELENVLEHGICFATGDSIELEDLPEYFLRNRISKEYPEDRNKITQVENNLYEHLLAGQGKSLEELQMEFEMNIIAQLVDIYGDSVEGKKIIAQRLGISLATLYRKMNNYSYNFS